MPPRGWGVDAGIPGAYSYVGVRAMKLLILAAALLFVPRCLAGIAYTVTIEAPLSTAAKYAGYFMNGHWIGLITAEPVGGSLFQEPDGSIHIPIGYAAPLEIDFFVRFTNDLGYAAEVVQTRPSGFGHLIGSVGANLNHPWSKNYAQGTFVHWSTGAGNLNLTLLPGGSYVTPFFHYELISAFGPVIPEVTTASGHSWPAYTLQAGDQSFFMWDVIGKSIDAPVPEPASVGLVLAGILGFAVIQGLRPRK
jgi:hypothetical protein